MNGLGQRAAGASVPQLPPVNQRARITIKTVGRPSPSEAHPDPRREMERSRFERHMFISRGIMDFTRCGKSGDYKMDLIKRAWRLWQVARELDVTPPPPPPCPVCGASEGYALAPESTERWTRICCRQCGEALLETRVLYEPRSTGGPTDPKPKLKPKLQPQMQPPWDSHAASADARQRQQQQQQQQHTHGGHTCNSTS